MSSFMKKELDDHLSLAVDRGQKNPLTMIIDRSSNDNTIKTVQESLGLKTRDKIAMTGGTTLLLSGLLQRYTLPQSVDYRLIKTFDRSSYLYMFGESPPIMQMEVMFSDGTLYLNSPTVTSGGGAIVANQESKNYTSIDIFEIMKNKLFLFNDITKTGNTAKEPLVGISFNRLLVRGYIVSVVSSGSADMPGLIAASMQMVVKDYSVIPPESNYEIRVDLNTIQASNTSGNEYVG